MWLPRFPVEEDDGVLGLVELSELDPLQDGVVDSKVALPVSGLTVYIEWCLQVCCGYGSALEKPAWAGVADQILEVPKNEVTTGLQ